MFRVIFLIMIMLLSAMNSFALPQDGNIVGGQGNINSSGNVMDINQQTQKLAIDWRSFNIGSQETVNFFQPNS